MKIYRVGGVVRDTLLGLPVKDIDYVVVGSSPKEMIAAGFQPVGNDFPVFLHPKTHAEYALARTERKSAPGYRGFVFHCAPDVTLEEDLKRRDLTMNAMAVAEEDALHSQIIDPFGGQGDLANHILRHVSDAFSEDPVRILRVARFAARFSSFTVAPETRLLMRSMVQTGEVCALVAERVWQEIARGLMENHPSRMLEVLSDTGAMEVIVPEMHQLYTASEESATGMRHIVDAAAKSAKPLAVRWAAMLSGGNIFSDYQLLRQLCARLKVPIEVRDITLLVEKEKTCIEAALSLKPEEIVSLLERCDAFRRPARFSEVLEAVTCIKGKSCQQDYLLRALSAAQTVEGKKIVETTRLLFPAEPQKIALVMSAARASAIKAILN